MPRFQLSADQVHHDLSLLWEHYRSGVVALLGGEPLLHRDLVAVIDAVQSLSAPPRVYVVTNGVLLPSMPAAFLACRRRCPAVPLSGQGARP